MGTVRPVTDILQTGQWAGSRAFIVGGGPSLRGFAFERLRGERVIAVNRSAEAVPWADVLFTMDLRFLTWFRRKLGKFEGALVYHHDTGADLGEQLLGDLGRDVHLVRRLGERAVGAALEDGVGDGANSGFGAVLLAWVLGARPIYLLGFDLNATTEGKQSWWHNGYPANNAAPYVRFRRNFEWLAGQLPEGSVLNISPTSSIRGFPKVAAWPPGPLESNLPLFVTYWTDDYYREQLERLAASCRALGLDLAAVHVEDRGNWVLNCAAKGEVVLAALDGNPGRDLVFVDADAEVVKRPDLFADLDADVAAHLRSGTELLSGTVFFRNNERVRRLVRRWISLGRDQSGEWDQRTLATAVREAIPRGLLFHDLPPAYTFIFDSMARQHPDVDPVILHHQASRKVKAMTRKGGPRGPGAVRGNGGRPGGTPQRASALDQKSVRVIPGPGSQAAPQRALPVRVGGQVQEVLPPQVPQRAAVPGGPVTGREVGGVKIPAPADVKMDGYATHQPAVVMAAVTALELCRDLPWAELGCGWYSTPTLAAIGGPDRLTVHSADPAWASRFARLVTVEHVDDWESFQLAGPHGLVLLDNEQLVVDRVKLLPRLLAGARLVVMHDWRDGLDEGLLGTAARYVYRQCGKPWTLIASTFIQDLPDRAAGRLG